jgi:hypothetical protein
LHRLLHTGTVVLRGQKSDSDVRAESAPQRHLQRSKRKLHSGRHVSGASHVSALTTAWSPTFAPPRCVYSCRLRGLRSGLYARAGTMSMVLAEIYYYYMFFEEGILLSEWWPAPAWTTTTKSRCCFHSPTPMPWLSPPLPPPPFAPPPSPLRTLVLPPRVRLPLLLPLHVLPMCSMPPPFLP